MDYIDLYSDEVITKEELTEFKLLVDEKTKQAKIKLGFLQEQLKECSEETQTLNLKEKLKELLTLKELTTKVLHSFVDKITAQKMVIFEFNITSLILCKKHNRQRPQEG